MIIKGQPKEFEGKPLISQKDSHKEDSEVYMGRVIIEFWSEKGEMNEDKASFAWSVDDPEQPSKEWIHLLLSSLKRATRHIEDTYQYRLERLTSSEE